MADSLFNTLNISARDMSNRMADLDTVANNLANLNTAGFQSTRQNFQEFFSSQNLEGNKINGSQILTNQGNIITTDNPYDWAIQGDGYFAVTLPDGKTGYTRDGEFQLDADQQLVNSSGYKLNWSGKIPTGTTDISIGSDGTVNAIASDGTSQKIGTVQLAIFANPTALVNAGNNVWEAGDNSGTAQMTTPGMNGSGTIQSHAYEASNVNPTDEMANLVQIERGFQMTSRVFQQTDTMIEEAIHLRKA